MSYDRGLPKRERVFPESRKLIIAAINYLIELDNNKHLFPGERVGFGRDGKWFHSHFENVKNPSDVDLIDAARKLRKYFNKQLKPAGFTEEHITARWEWFKPTWPVIIEPVRRIPMPWLYTDNSE